MSGGMVEYIIALKDMFSAAAERVAKASVAAEKAIGGMGKATDAAEKALAGAGAAMDRIGAGATKASTALRGSADQMRINARNAAQMETMERNWSKATKARMEQEEAAAIKAQERAKKAAGGRFSGNHLGNAFMTAWLGENIVLSGMHSADHAIRQAADVDTMMRKISMSQGGGAAGQSVANDAYRKAFDLSGKYKNTTVEENLKIINDLRANLPENIHHVIGEATEPFVKLHGFLKAWEGGKHAGGAEKALQEVGIAIRSGELMGNLSSDQLAMHVNNIAMSKIAFGDKFKLSEYFTAQKSASAAINAADDTFKYVDFPALVQALGSRAGTGLATLYNKTVGGIMMPQSSANVWDAFGMVNQGNVVYGKGGIQTSSLKNNEWLKNGEVAGRNFTEWMMGTVVPAIGGVNATTKYAAEKGVKGLDGQAFAKVWDDVKNARTQSEAESGIAKLTDMTKHIDRNSLSKVLAALGYNQKAIMEMEEIVLRAGAIARDRRSMELVRQNEMEFKDYSEALQEVSSQANRAWLAMTGRDFVPWISQNLRAVGEWLTSVGDAFKAHPLLGTATGTAGAATGIYAVGRALTWLTKIPMLGPIGAVLTIGYEVWQNWDKLAAAIERATNAVRKWLTESGTKATAEWNQARVGEAYAGVAAVAGAGPSGSFPAPVGNSPGEMIFGPGGLSGLIGDLYKSITATPTKVEVTAPPTVQLQGTIDASGIIRMQGNMPLSASAPTGQSTPSGPAPQ